MSACCDGSAADSCPCGCHAYLEEGRQVMEGFLEGLRAEPLEDFEEWWAGARAALEANLSQLMARDIFGAEARVAEVLHPLLDPEAPAPALEADPVPPVDPSMVTWPMDATRELRVGDRLIGYESGGMVHVTDRNAMRALQRGIPLAVSIRPLPAPEWDVAEGWLDPDKLDP